MKQRADWTHAPEDDIDVLRRSLDRGVEWTKDDAKAALGWGERRFRATVAALRDEGYPVIATSEKGSTYRKAWSEAELEQFIHRELQSRIRRMDYQIAALRNAAPRHFGVAVPEQGRLIG